MAGRQTAEPLAAKLSIGWEHWEAGACCVSASQSAREGGRVRRYWEIFAFSHRNIVFVFPKTFFFPKLISNIIQSYFCFASPISNCFPMKVWLWFSAPATCIGHHFFFFLLDPRGFQLHLCFFSQPNTFYGLCLCVSVCVIESLVVFLGVSPGPASIISRSQKERKSRYTLYWLAYDLTVKNVFRPPRREITIQKKKKNKKGLMFVSFRLWWAIGVCTRVSLVNDSDQQSLWLATIIPWNWIKTVSRIILYFFFIPHTLTCACYNRVELKLFSPPPICTWSVQSSWIGSRRKCSTCRFACCWSPCYPHHVSLHFIFYCLWFLCCVLYRDLPRGWISKLDVD